MIINKSYKKDVNISKVKSFVLLHCTYPTYEK